MNNRKWQPIGNLSYAGIKGREMFVVKSLRPEYNSDPYCVWRENDKFVRWPHEFAPTHFMKLPDNSDIGGQIIVHA
jgi:hypothetical protein